MQITNSEDTTSGKSTPAQQARTDDKTHNTHDHLPLVVAVDLGGTQIRAAVLRGASLLSRVNLLTGENPTPERIIPRIFGTIEEALSKAGITLKQVAGIGIGAPGPLDIWKRTARWRRAVRTRTCAIRCTSGRWR